jgi:predicted TIM-barrel fold metal-dependent hydrolase
VAPAAGLPIVDAHQHFWDPGVHYYYPWLCDEPPIAFRYGDYRAEAIRSSAGILLIVAAAFGWILSVEGVPQQLTRLMLQISTNPYVLLAIVNVLLLLVGMFLESRSS